MKQKSMSESAATKIISDLTKKIHTSSPMKDSVYEEASNYFAQLSTIEEQREAYKNQLLTAEENLAKNTNTDQEKILKKKKKECLIKIKRFESELENQRLDRVQKLNNVCVEILSQCTGVNSIDTNKKFAKLLGTLSLRMPEGNNVSLQYNKQSKHLYQAVLSLKLLEQLIADKLMSNKYIMGKYSQSDSEKDDSFRNEVQIPLLFTALLQNIGLLHPDAQQILKGETGEKDEFRVLDKEERLALLKYNYQQSTHYIKEGLGLDKYSGNSKEEREIFNKKENEKISFILTLLKTALKPKQGIGNLLKVPEIYTSVVMPTKRDYDYAAIPRVFKMMDNAVERGVLSKDVVNNLLKITGVFPQGYGITYIPQSDDGYDLDIYEYAIVNSLYPKKPQNPICRIATKHLLFNSSGIDYCIEPDNNLYFAHARKKLGKVNPERLKEILSKLWSNYEVRQEQFELIPRCWFPHEFFSLAKQQNIWNKTIPDLDEKA
jgi:hypothetical protein